jgi:hypothetical protein
MWCGLTSAGVIRPFFFHEKRLRDAVYVDMLENHAVPQVPDGYVFQQDRELPHFRRPVNQYLNEQFAACGLVEVAPFCDILHCLIFPP